MLYGRGVNDDKGPLLAALYAARIIRGMGLPLKRSIRVIAVARRKPPGSAWNTILRVMNSRLWGFRRMAIFPNCKWGKRDSKI